MKGDAIEDLALLEGEFTVIGQFLIQRVRHQRICSEPIGDSMKREQFISS